MVDTAKINAPMFDSLVRKDRCGTHDVTLGTLLARRAGAANVNIVRTTGNEVLVRAMQSVHDAVKEGEHDRATGGSRSSRWWSRWWRSAKRPALYRTC